MAVSVRNLHCEYWSEQEPYWHPEGTTRIKILDGQTWKARLTFEYYSVIAEFVYLGCHMDMGSGRWNTTEQYGLLHATTAWTLVTQELPESLYSKFDLGNGRTIDCEKYVLDQNKNKLIGDWDADVYVNRVVGSPTFTNLTAEYGSDQEPSWHAPGVGVPIAHGDNWSAKLRFKFNGTACTVVVAAAMKMPNGNWNTASMTLSLPNTLDATDTTCVVTGVYDRFGLDASRYISVDKYIAWPNGTTILRDGDVDCYFNIIGDPEFTDLTAEYWSDKEPSWHAPGSAVPIAQGDGWSARIKFKFKGVACTVDVAAAMKMPNGNWNTALTTVSLPDTLTPTETIRVVVGTYERFGLEECKRIDVDKYIAWSAGATILRDGDTECFHNTTGASEFRNLTAEYGSEQEQWWHSAGSFVPVGPGNFYDGRIHYEHKGIEETVTVAIAMKMPGGAWNTASAEVTIPQSADWVAYYTNVRGYYVAYGLEVGRAIDVDKYIAKLTGESILRDGDTDCFISTEEEEEVVPDPMVEMMSVMMPMMMIMMMMSMIPQVAE